MFSHLCPSSTSDLTVHFIIFYCIALYCGHYCSAVDVAVEEAHKSIMFNMGQVCCAGSRTYVHEDIYDEFVKRSVERAKKRTTGDPFKAENENGPQVS